MRSLKIVFANEMGALCAELGVSGREIMATLCEDVKLKISRWLDPTLDHLLGWAEHLVLAQRPAPELAHRIRQSGLPVLDLVQSL